MLEEAESFEHLAGYAPSSVSWRGREGAVTLRAARVSPSMFPLLRATPQLGRLFTEGEARAGTDRVVLLSHGAWTRRFGSDPDIAGAVVGLGASAASSRVLESFLYGVTTDDRLTFVAAPLVLVTVALVACWLPARRATRVDPMEVLRDE